MKEIEREMLRIEHENFYEELLLFYKYTNRGTFNLKVSMEMLKNLLEMNEILLERTK